MFRARNVRKQRVSAKRTRSLVVCLFSFSSNLTFSSLLLSLSLYGNNERTGSWVKFPKYSPDRWEIRRQLYIPQMWYVKRLNEQPVGEFCSESFLVDEAQLPASIHDIFYLHITEQTSMGAMTIFACRERHENEVLTKQVAELHLTRISTLPKFRPKHRRRYRRRGETRTPLLHRHPDGSLLLPFFVISIRLNATPERFEILGGRTKYLPPSSRIQLAGHRRTSLYPRGGKGKGNLTSCLGAGK